MSTDAIYNSAEQMRNPMAKVPTVYDVAELAKVSIATVSFTFQRPEKVRDKTRETVLAAAAQLGYVPSGSARGLAQGKTGVLGLFSFDFLEEERNGSGSRGAEDELDAANDDLERFPLYIDEVQRGVEFECWRQGYSLMVSGVGSLTSERAIRDLAGRVDGLAVFPRSLPTTTLERLAKRIPVVEISEAAANPQLDHPTVDNVSGMRMMIEHLHGVHGVSDLALVGPTDASEAQLRRDAATDAIRARNISLRPPALTGNTPEHSVRYVKTLLDADELPQALVCVTDQDALAVMRFLLDAGVRVPFDVLVTGFDGIAGGRISRPSLTTIRQPMEQLGREAVRMLLGRIAEPDRSPARSVLPVSLVTRESCGCRTSFELSST